MLNRSRNLRAFSPGIHDPVARASLGSYRSTDLNRARLINRDGSGDRHADDFSRRLARELARDQDRSSGIYRALVTTFLDLMIGEGVDPRPLSADPTWNAKASDLFERESSAKGEGFDVEGVDTYAGLQRKWGRAVVNDGDLLLVKIQGGKLATIEADRIAGRAGGNQYKRAISGVQVRSDTGQRLAYGVCPYDGSGNYVVEERVQWYDVSQVIYCGTASRKSQVRSLPALVANLDDSERADSLIEASIITAEQASMIWGWVQDQAGNAAGGAVNPLAPVNADGSAALGGKPDTGVVTWQDWVAGTLGFLGKREFKQAQTALPNLNVVDFVRFLVRMFGAELGVPYELALLDVGKLSWSSNQALLAFCERRLQVWRDQTFGPLFSSIYRWRIGTYMALGWLPERDDWWKHEHEWPDPPAINGPDQVSTDRGNLAMGRTSLHRLNGRNWQRVLDERAAEIRYAAEQAAKINQDNPEAEVSWRDLTSADTRAAVTGLTVDTAKDDAAPPAKSDNSQQE